MRLAVSAGVKYQYFHSNVPYAELLTPECWGEENQQSENFQPAKQHCYH
ncbi:hypothetical protein FORC065_4206 [Yersinia enterocolitica]|nr:hypothetical protein FORC065_4206 [Yersinia enterocolitica]